MLNDLRRFASTLGGRRHAVAALFALGLAGAGASLATPLLGKAFIDAVATRGDYAAIPWIAAALAGLAVLDLALGAWSGRLHARLSADVLARLRATLFGRCVDAPLGAVEPFRHGDLLTRFGTDLPRIEALLVDGLLGSLQHLLFLAVAAAITFSLSPVLALWSFAGLALALLATAAFRGGVEARTRRVRDAMAELSHFLAERLAALRAIRLHRTQREEAARLATVTASLNREVVAFQLWDALASGGPGLVLTASLAWIYVVGGDLLASGAISLGTFVAFVLYQARLFEPARGLLGLLRHLQEARVSVARVTEVLDAGAPGGEAAGDPPASARGAALALHEVAFGYEGRPAVFERASLRIEPGERVALFGASGAGKSTLVHLLFGLRSPAGGSVWVDGRDAQRRDDEPERAGLGYAGAEPFLLHATVEENLRYGNPEARREDLQRAVALAAADTFIEALPDGYATVIGGRGLALSDGQRQRLGLARLFLRDPRMLVLDEAFSGLDLGTEMRVRRNLWAAFPDRTVLVVSHRPVGLEAFDRLLYLRDGRFATVTADELRALLVAGRARPPAVPVAPHERAA